MSEFKQTFAFFLSNHQTSNSLSMYYRKMNIGLFKQPSSFSWKPLFTVNTLH